MSDSIADFGNSELWVIQSTLKERYNRDIPFEIGDSEIRLLPSDRTLTPCPVIYWNVENVNFVIFKTGAERYRCQFYYRLYQQYGTNKFEFDNIGDCVITLLQTQADYATQEKQNQEKQDQENTQT
ncbi:hypothetical protein [Candidatus Venteria ishoeyi]|uniref:Uncharacterized protein n=1 Tax=Candidatus Venteria ishoeyi TaxID=1899563 RepID=A0A1H6FBP4_9GAMM|nr:hypothetical protein [Candidatus Venteria ishoeyi]MDM8547349.1 hypothetical protein [Candidatus Venteria ishoeyi]SEH07508.1 Uncharacterised protein [Candidatus Venteria ishoeyi]